MEYYSHVSGVQYLTMTYDQYYYVKKLCSMFDNVSAPAENRLGDGMIANIRVDYIINNFRLILLTHASLLNDPEHNKFMAELQRVLEIP